MRARVPTLPRPYPMNEDTTVDFGGFPTDQSTPPYLVLPSIEVLDVPPYSVYPGPSRLENAVSLERLLLCTDMR